MGVKLWVGLEQGLWLEGWESWGLALGLRL